MMVFRSFNSLIVKSVTRRLVYITILVLEFIQYMSFILPAGSDSFHDDSLFLAPFMDYVEFTHFFMDTDTFKYGYYIAVGVIGLYSCSFLLFFLWHAGESQLHSGLDSEEEDHGIASASVQSSSFLATYIGKPLSVVAILHREFLLIPTSILLMMIFYCTASYTEEIVIEENCQNGVHIAMMCVSSLLLLFSLTLAIASSIFYSDTQPDSALPWANCNTGMVLLKLLKKVIIIVCTVLSFKISGLELIMLILLNIVNCFSIARMSRHLHMNDRFVHGFLLCSEGGVAWLCLVGLIQRLFSIGSANDLYAMLSIPVMFFLLRAYVFNKSKELIHTCKVEYLPDEGAMEQYVSVMCNIFEGQSRCGNYITLQGVFASHIRTCTSSSCPCEEISRALEPGGGEENLSASTSVMKSVRAISIKQTIQRNLSIHSADIPLTEFNSINNKKFYEFMRSLIERAILTVSKTTRLYIQLGYIHFLSLENKFIALYNLMNAQDSKPSLFEEFLIYRLKNRIEEELKSEEERYGKMGNLTLHINQQITFQQNFADFQSRMSKSLEFYISFWKELMEETPNFIYLNKLGYEIARESTQIRQMYRRLAKANPNNIQCKMIYALFLRKIEKDEYESFEICEQVIEAKNKQRVRRGADATKDEKYGANCKAAIILISGNKSNVGEVLNANNELSEILGYDKRDIIGSSISKIMPAVIGQKHNELIKEYFHKKGSVKQSSHMDNEKIVFAIDKYGHIVPCTLFHKLVPNLVKGIQLIGFIFLADDLALIRQGEEKVKPEFLAIVLTDSTWAIHGFNNKFARLFKLDLSTVDIRKYLNAEEKLNIGKLVAEIEDNDNLSKMKSEEGLLIDLDVEKVSREIEAEIDAIQPQQLDAEERKSDNLDSSDSLTKDLRMDTVSTNTKHRTKTVNVKCIDQDYGKNNATKDFMFALRVLSFRIHSPILSGMVPLPESTPIHRHGGRIDEKDVFSKLLEERQSQSQTSSHYSVLKYHGKVIKDFKSKMHTMQEPIVLKWLYRIGFFVFLILLGLGITQLLLKKREFGNCRDAMANIRNAYYRLNKINNICLFSRSLFEVFREFGTVSSALIPDRVAYYKEKIELDLESLREVHNVLLKSGHSFSSGHTDLLSNQAHLVIWEMADSAGIDSKYRFTNTSFNIGVTNFIARSTDISGLSESILKAGVSSSALNESTRENIDRLEYYIMKNGRDQFRDIAESSSQMFLSESVEEFKGQRLMHYVISTLGTACVLLIVAFFVPYIMKVQRNILKVFDHMSGIKQEEIKKILDMCYTFKDEIEAPIARLKALYDKEDFGMTTDEMRKEEKAQRELEAKRRQNQKMLKKLTNNRANVTHNEDEEGEELNKKEEESEESKEKARERETQYLAYTEERRTNAKKKLFSVLTSQKRKGYICRLFSLFLFFSIFLIVDIFLLISFFDNTIKTYDLIGLYHSRSTFLQTTTLFCREDLVVAELLNSDRDQLGHYLDKSFEREEETLTVTNHLTGYFEDMKLFIAGLESNTSCQHFTSSATETELCQTVFNQFMSHGLSMAIMRILREIQTIHMAVARDIGNSKLWSGLRGSSEVVEMNDVLAYFIDRAFEKAAGELSRICEDYLGKVETDDNIRFSVFVVFLVLITAILWMNMLNNLNTDILRAKGVFNILPTYLLSENTEFIKDISDASIFT